MNENIGDELRTSDTAGQLGYPNPESTGADTTDGGTVVRPIEMPNVSDDLQAAIPGQEGDSGQIFSDHPEDDSDPGDEGLSKEAQGTMIGRIQTSGG